MSTLSGGEKLRVKCEKEHHRQENSRQNALPAEVRDPSKACGSATSSDADELLEETYNLLLWGALGAECSAQAFVNALVQRAAVEVLEHVNQGQNREDWDAVAALDEAVRAYRARHGDS
jgi:hypothetical protein